MMLFLEVISDFFFYFDYKENKLVRKWFRGNSKCFDLKNFGIYLKSQMKVQDLLEMLQCNPRKGSEKK